MEILLSKLQQLVSPLMGIWPVWLLLILSVVITARLNRIKISRWILWFGIGIGLLFVLLRFVFLTSFPLEERSNSLHVTSPEVLDLPLFVTFRNGKLSVEHTRIDIFTLNSKDVSEGYFLARNQYLASVGDKRTTIDALVFKRKNEMSLFTKVWSDISLGVPSTYRGNEEFVLYDAVSNLDFTESTTATVNISSFTSGIEVMFPKTAGTKRFNIQLESSTGKFFIPEGPAYIFVKNTAYPIHFPTDFQQIEENTFKREGSTEGVVTVHITSRIPKSLEVISINEHNK